MSKLPIIEGREARVAAAAPTVEYRAAADGTQEPTAFVGQAIVCGKRSVSLGYPGFRFVEIIDARALDNAKMDDVVGVFNHNNDCVLGRTKSGTLTLSRSADGGLDYRIPYDSLDDDHRRVMRKIERGDVVGSSFVFSTTADEWAEEKDTAGGSLYVRTVTAIEEVFDVCPVTNPAYTDSKAAKRSHDAYEQAHPLPPTGVPLELLEQELALKARR